MSQSRTPQCTGKSLSMSGFSVCLCHRNQCIPKCSCYLRVLRERPCIKLKTVRQPASCILEVPTSLSAGGSLEFMLTASGTRLQSFSKAPGTTNHTTHSNSPSIQDGAWDLRLTAWSRSRTLQLQTPRTEREAKTDKQHRRIGLYNSTNWKPSCSLWPRKHAGKTPK